jgi:hypothetical protein
MISYSVSQIFNIPENYSLEDLKISYKNIIDNLLVSQRSNIEKQLLANQYKELYRIGKEQFYQRNNQQINLFSNNIFDNLFNMPQINMPSNSINNVYSYQSSYKSKLNSDGSTTVMESKTEIKNGEKKDTINNYKRMPDGTIIPLNNLPNYNIIKNK